MFDEKYYNSVAGLISVVQNSSAQSNAYHNAITNLSLLVQCEEAKEVFFVKKNNKSIFCKLCACYPVAKEVLEALINKFSINEILETKTSAQEILGLTLANKDEELFLIIKEAFSKCSKDVYQVKFKGDTDFCNMCARYQRYDLIKQIIEDNKQLATQQLCFISSGKYQNNLSGSWIVMMGENEKRVVDLKVCAHINLDIIEKSLVQELMGVSDINFANLTRKLNIGSIKQDKEVLEGEVKRAFLYKILRNSKFNVPAKILLISSSQGMAKQALQEIVSRDGDVFDFEVDPLIELVVALCDKVADKDFLLSSLKKAQHNWRKTPHLAQAISSVVQKEILLQTNLAQGLGENSNSKSTVKFKI